MRTRFDWKRMSMVAALAYAPGRDGARVLFDCQAGSYNDESLIGFIDELHRELAGAKVTLIWDGLPSHRSRAMRAYLATQRRWLVVERLPAYAPELNPVEALWGNLKGSELANLVVDTIAETESVARAGIERVRDETQLAFAFLRHTGLFL